MGIDHPVHLCDTFKGVVKAGPRDTVYLVEHSDTNQGAVLRLIRSLNLDQVNILQGIFPEESGGHSIGDRRFAFVISTWMYMIPQEIFWTGCGPVWSPEESLYLTTMDFTVAWELRRWSMKSELKMTASSYIILTVMES